MFEPGAVKIHIEDLKASYWFLKTETPLVWGNVLNQVPIYNLLGLSLQEEGQHSMDVHFNSQVFLGWVNELWQEELKGKVSAKKKKKKKKNTNSMSNIVGLYKQDKTVFYSQLQDT